MATFVDFEGLIDDFCSFGAPTKFITSSEGLTTQSFVRLHPNDVRSIVDNIWNYHTRLLTESYGTDDIMTELQSHRRATEDSKFLLKPRS